MRIFFFSFFLSCFFLEASEKIELFSDWGAKELALQEDSKDLFSSIYQESKKRHLDLVFKSLKEEKEFVKKPSLLKTVKEWFFEKEKERLPKEVAGRIFFNIENAYQHIDFSLYPKKKLVLFLWEPPTVIPFSYEKSFLENFGRVYTWDDSLVDNKKFFKFHYPELKEVFENIPSFKDRKLCTFISARLESNYPKELYTERERAIQFFERHPEDFDFYGRHWEKRKYQTYKGAPQDKMAVLKNYRFCICYENTKEVEGYVTEKIFDCFATLCVPVYYGAPNVEKYIPKKCFIDRRDFSSYEELYHFLKSMSEEEYLSYQKEIKKFLQSKEAKKFSVENFSETFSTAVEYLLEN